MSAAARRARALALLGALLVGDAGCRVLVELVESTPAGPDASGGADGAPRADADPACSTWSFTPAHVDPCAIPPAGADLVLGPGRWTYDTNSGALTDPDANATFPPSALVTPAGEPELRVVSVARFELQAGATLRATGKRPLVIVSWSDLEVAGAIDVGGAAGAPGAGANPDACPASSTLAGADNANGGGGGGGGGFGSVGASGGTGGGGPAAAGTGGPAVPLPAALRGGCNGGAGGNSLAGAGGRGGGALDLIARGTVEIRGTVAAGGAGGGASTGARSGGGGGGAGGQLHLQGSTVRLVATAILAANGGGGGGGADGGAALPGADAQLAAAAAPGGAGQGMGASGGAGAFAQTAATPGAMAMRGGGGGGGGRGFVIVRAATYDDQGAVASPAVVRP